MLHHTTDPFKRAWHVADHAVRKARERARQSGLDADARIPGQEYSLWLRTFEETLRELAGSH